MTEAEKIYKAAMEEFGISESGLIPRELNDRQAIVAALKIELDDDTVRAQSLLDRHDSITREINAALWGSGINGA